MNKKLLTTMIILVGILCLANVFAADCTLYSTATSTSGSDYMGVNTSGNNNILMGADNAFGSLTFFTPRLNFTREVSENLLGLPANNVSTLNWKTTVDVSSTFNVTNTSSGLIIDSANYTLTQNLTSGLITITWLNSAYSGVNVTYRFVRTFIKNTEDLVTNPGAIYTSSTTSNWLTQSGGTTYGVNEVFKLNAASLGSVVNISNWAVGWNQTDRTCIATTADSPTFNGINNTKALAYAAFGLIAVMILVFAAWGLISVFNGGNADLTTIATITIGGGLIVMIAYVILFYVAKALIGA